MSEPKPLLAPLKPAQVAARVWKDGRFRHDAWTVLADDAPLPASGQVVVSVERWRREVAHATNGSVKNVAILLTPDQTIDLTQSDLRRIPLVLLTFPKFGDGRAYSQARRLREAGYTGELRATGDVLLDQLPLMLRAGIDAFEITSAATVRALEAGKLPAVTHVYQPHLKAGDVDWRARRSG